MKIMHSGKRIVLNIEKIDEHKKTIRKGSSVKVFIRKMALFHLVIL